MSVMKKILLRLLGAASVLLFSLGCGQRSGGQSQPEVQTLSNGVRVAVVPWPGSTNVFLFTFLPMSLASDGPGQAQWSHLVEHLVLRSTMPDDLRQANAETAPDHMRLDFYDHTGSWKDGLAQVQRWLEGVPFTEASLATEAPKVVAECDSAAKNFATHKFALAAWSQGFRHGISRVEMKGDVLRAALKDVQRYRDERLVVPGQTTLCLVGGVDAKLFLAEAEKHLGGIQSKAKPAAPAKRPAGNLDLTWDLEARHLVLTWPIPDFKHEDHAALMAAARSLTMRFQSDPVLDQQTGSVLAGVDLGTPEGRFFYISASLLPGAAFADVEKIIRALVRRLATNPNDEIPLLGQQLSFSLTSVADPAAFLAQAPPGMSPVMKEANAGLPVCMNVHRYGAQRELLARRLANLSAGKVQKAVANHLAQQACSVCTIRPVAEAKRN